MDLLSGSVSSFGDVFPDFSYRPTSPSIAHMSDTLSRSWNNIASRSPSPSQIFNQRSRPSSTTFSRGDRKEVKRRQYEEKYAYSSRNQNPEPEQMAIKQSSDNSLKVPPKQSRRKSDPSKCRVSPKILKKQRSKSLVLSSMVRTQLLSPPNSPPQTMSPVPFFLSTEKLDQNPSRQMSCKSINRGSRPPSCISTISRISRGRSNSEQSQTSSVVSVTIQDPVTNYVRKGEERYWDPLTLSARTPVEMGNGEEIVLVLGSEGVGKSALIKRLEEYMQKFRCLATENLVLNFVEVDPSKDDLWLSLMPQKNIIIVFSLVDKDSLDDAIEATCLLKCHQQLKSNKDKSNLMLFVGTKLDQTKLGINSGHKRAEKFAKSRKIPFLQASCTHKLNVDSIWLAVYLCAVKKSADTHTITKHLKTKRTNLLCLKRTSSDPFEDMFMMLREK